jgi:hypothetical protein
LVWKNNQSQQHRMTVAIAKPDAEFVIVGTENVFITELRHRLFHRRCHIKVVNFVDLSICRFINLKTMNSCRVSFQGKRDRKNPGWGRLVGLAVWVSKCLDPVCPAADLERQR